MRIRLSDKKQGILGIAGHAGSGHCHSHNAYLQDDSGGLAAVLALFQSATSLPLTIRDVRVKTGIDGSIAVETVSGGTGVCAPKRGVTLHEARLAKSVEGKEALCSQALAMEAFGRFYGQGVHETPVALQTAIANAAVDSFVRNFPEHFIHASENLERCCGRIAGAVLDFDDIPISVLATVNATSDGSGPVEDMEGNVCIGSKKTVMRQLGMEMLPTIIIEGKVYSPGYSDTAAAPYFLVRHDPETDNPAVGEAIVRSAQALGCAVQLREDVMRRVPKALEKKTIELGEAIVLQGEALKNARFSQEKTRILSEIARLVSEDGAGISFMSDRLHEIVGGVGVMPGTGAVLTLVVPKSYRDQHVFPFLTQSDLSRYTDILRKSVAALSADLPRAMEYAKKRACRIDLDALACLRDTTD